MFAKYSLNGLWTEEQFQRHEKIKTLMEKNGIPIPSWFDEVGTRWVTYNIKDEKTGNYEWVTAVEVLASDVEKRKELEESGYDMTSDVHNYGRPLHHRRMSNNSIAFTRKPTEAELELVFEMLQMEGEPGFVNLEELARRRLKAQGIENPSRELLEQVMEEIGMNPCAEIDLYNRGVCNLTTVNVLMFIENRNGKYVLNRKKLLQAQRRSARAGIRMTLAELEKLPFAEDPEAWDRTQKTDRLIGTSVTGWKDALAILGFNEEEEAKLLQEMSDVVADECEKYSRFLRIAAPLLDTTVKPEGTLSQVASSNVLRSPVSSGLHWSHAPYFIRRVRISAVDPLAKAVQEMGWMVNPEVGTPGDTHEERMANAKTIVVDFPIKSGSNVTKDDVTAIQQLETYMRFQKSYTRHNSSNTITVKSGEWDDVRGWIFDRWDEFCAVSFLSHDGGTYQLAPYEAITEEKYNELAAKMTPFDPLTLQLIEGGIEQEIEIDQSGCEAGVCPIR